MLRKNNGGEGFFVGSSVKEVSKYYFK